MRVNLRFLLLAFTLATAARAQDANPSAAWRHDAARDEVQHASADGRAKIGLWVGDKGPGVWIDTTTPGRPGRASVSVQFDDKPTKAETWNMFLRASGSGSRIESSTPAQTFAAAFGSKKFRLRVTPPSGGASQLFEFDLSGAAEAFEKIKPALEAYLRKTAAQKPPSALDWLKQNSR